MFSAGALGENDLYLLRRDDERVPVEGWFVDIAWYASLANFA